MLNIQGLYEDFVAIIKTTGERGAPRNTWEIGPMPPSSFYHVGTRFATYEEAQKAGVAVLRPGQELVIEKRVRLA